MVRLIGGVPKVTPICMWCAFAQQGSWHNKAQGIRTCARLHDTIPIFQEACPEFRFGRKMHPCPKRGLVWLEKCTQVGIYLGTDSACTSCEVPERAEAYLQQNPNRRLLADIPPEEQEEADARRAKHLKERGRP